MEMTNESNRNQVQQKANSLNLSSQDKKVVLEQLNKPLAFVPHDNFQLPVVMNEIMEQNINALSGQSLKVDEEKALFMQYNYARYKLCQIRQKLLNQTRGWKTNVREMLDWYHKQIEIRNKIVTANIGLVLAMAQRSDFPGVEFTDLVSEGSMALMRATDKFDCSQGYKFSTYACRAIFRGFSHAAKQNYRYRSRFSTQWDITFEKSDELESARREQHVDWVDEVRIILDQNLANLSGIEQSVVSLRFPLDDKQRKPLTLKQIGEKFGVTKERIRQIQKKALAKLGTAVQEHMEMA